MGNMRNSKILESLQFNRVLETTYNDDMLGDMLYESVEFDTLWSEDADVVIDEAKAVTFDKKTFPKEGWAVVMAGGAGSGKGTALNRQILIDGKILDVDQIKSMFAKISANKDVNTLISKYTLGRKFDFKNPNDVSDLHAMIGTELGLDDKKTEVLLKSIVSGNRLQNIIFDITGKSPGKLMNIANSVKRLGYKVSLVWVVTNRQVAMMRNLMRDRVVGELLFHSIHNQVNSSVFSFLQSAEAKDYDEAWILFSSTDKVSDLTPQEQKDLFKDSAFKLKKTGSGFEIPSTLTERIMTVLGPQEKTPEKPSTYQDYKTVQGMIDKLPTKKATKSTGVGMGTKEFDVKTYRDLNLLKK
jgi:hypothetical protein